MTIPHEREILLSRLLAALALRSTAYIRGLIEAVEERNGQTERPALKLHAPKRRRA